MRWTFGQAARGKGLPRGLRSLCAKAWCVLGGKPSSSESLSATLLWDRDVSPAARVLQADLFSHLISLLFELGSVRDEALRFTGEDWESGL